MGRPRSISDDAIRTAAREVFVEHGPGAPVSLVAKRLGVTHAALFSRVGTKDELMLDSLCPGQPAAVEALSRPPPTSRVQARLRDILLDLMSFLSQVAPNLVMLRAAGHTADALPDTSRTPPPVALRRLLARWLEAATEAGTIARVDGPATAEALLGAIEARCFNAYLGGPAFAPGTDSAFVRKLVTALVPRVRGTRRGR